jgi:hypothetical protein
MILITYILNTLSVKLTGIQIDTNEYANAIMNGTIDEYARSCLKTTTPARPPW